MEESERKIIEEEYINNIHAFENLNAALELMIAGTKVYSLQYPNDKTMAYGAFRSCNYINSLMLATAQAITAQRSMLGKTYVNPEDVALLFRTILMEERGMTPDDLDKLQNHYHKPEDNLPKVEKLSTSDINKMLSDVLSKKKKEKDDKDGSV